jgi:hypothetical protein
MARLSASISAVALLALAAPPAVAERPDPGIADYLEGDWLVGEKPDKGTCIAHWYKGTEIEFEFRKSGGRVLQFEHYDLFTAIDIPEIDRDGDVLIVQGRSRDGKILPLYHLRMLPPDRVEFLPKDGDKVTAYRCGSPDRTVTGSLPIGELSALTPPVTGSLALAEAIPGVSDADLCQGNVPADRRPKSPRWLQFELLGPVHYWVIGSGFGPAHKLEFDFVRRVDRFAAGSEHGLKLRMQEHVGGDGWDVPEPRGKTYDLTVIERGSHFEIPELSATFVRCDLAAPTGLGMHRW